MDGSFQDDRWREESDADRAAGTQLRDERPSRRKSWGKLQSRFSLFFIFLMTQQRLSSPAEPEIDVFSARVDGPESASACFSVAKVYFPAFHQIRESDRFRSVSVTGSDETVFPHKTSFLLQVRPCDGVELFSDSGDNPGRL